MPYFVPKNEANKRIIAPNKYALNYIGKEINPRVSFATTTGVDFEETETTPNNRIYFVISGVLNIRINNDEFVLKNGDCLYIEADSEYTMKGSFEAVVVNEPAFGTK